MRHGHAALRVFFAAHAVVAAVALLLPNHPTARAQLLSPGPLSSDHARLEGDAHCNDCHTAGRGVSTQGCLHCHAPVAARIRAGQGLHGREYRGRSCGECHVEHLGRRAAQIRWPGGSRDRFDHRLTGWPLQGAHARTECADCHRGRSYIGLRTACASCHEDPHGGRFGATCTDCHDQSSFSTPNVRSIDHARTRYPLEGAHRNVACARCHTGTPPRYRGLEFASCSNCHRDPHGGRFEQPCASCHVVSGFSNLDAVRQDHPGLSLANGHARVRCQACHDRGLDARPSRGDRCVSCHHEVHEAPFGRDCAQCHRNIRWTGLGREIGLSAHARTPFPLRGKHEDVACGSCHPSDRSADARYRQLRFDECRACHSDDPHRGQMARFDGGECGGCHDERGFAPSRFDPSMHARTDFPLEGRHEAVACSGCHTLPRPRLSFQLTAHACAECHENPHGDQFAPEMARGGCASCHSVDGWRRPRIDHSTWPLTGAHERAACERCHQASERDRMEGRGAGYRGVPRTCEGCHSDAHAGQFRMSEPVRQCTDCHSTEAFTIERFAHRERTGFAIDGSHARLECSDCHPSVPMAEQRNVVVYRLGFRRCQDCHANPHIERQAPGGRR